MSRPFIGNRQTALRLRGDANKEWINRQLLKRGEPIITDWKTKGKVAARIHYGDWQVICPMSPRHAEFGDPEWPVFVCTECGEGPLEVVFPKNREAIEALIVESVRLNENRHWDEGDTITDLKKMYRAQGIEVK